MRTGLYDDLAVFLAVAETGSMAAAARRLAIDPSTVSRRVGRLEEELGVALFQRTGTGMALSEPGRRLATRVRRATDQVELGIDEAVRPPEGMVGDVRVTAPTEIGGAFLVPVLRDLQRVHPGIHVTLDLGARILSLGESEADLAVRTVRPTHGDVVTRRLAGGALVACHAPGIDPGDVRRRWVAWMGGDPVVEPLVASIEGARVVLRSNDLAGLRAACVEGVGVAVLPVVLARHHGLVPLEGATEVPGLPLWLAAPTTALERPRVRAVWDAVLAAWAELSSRESGSEEEEGA